MVTARDLTALWPVTKSYTDDRAPRNRTRRYRDRVLAAYRDLDSQDGAKAGPRRSTSLSQHSQLTGELYVIATRADSDLEAFNHNPTDGSFAPMAFQPSACAKYQSLRFLSYWAGLL